MSEQHPSRSGVKSVEVAFRLINAIAEARRPLALRELAVAAAMSPSKAHRYLVSLMRVGLVDQQAGTRHYVLGSAALHVGLAAVRQSDGLQRALRLQARVRDAVAETVILSVWGSHGPTILHIEESDQPVQLTMKIGAILPITTTAAGRIFMAYMPSETVQRAVAEQLSADMPCSEPEATWVQLDAVAEAVRREGLARSIDEYAPGVATLAAPLIDSDKRLVAALGVMGRSGHIDTRPDGSLAGLLRGVCAEFGGYAPAPDDSQALLTRTPSLAP